MGNQGRAFRVHEGTLRLMVPGMLMEGFRQACHNATRPLILVLDDDSEVSGAHLYRQFVHLCSDYKEE